MAECPICLESLGDYGDPFDSLLTMLECGETLEPPSTVCHSFHRACLNGWREANPENKQTCPTCRRRVNVEEFYTAREAHDAKHALSIQVVTPTAPREHREQRECFNIRLCAVYSGFTGAILLFILAATGTFADYHRRM